MKSQVAKNCRVGKLYQRFMPILVWVSVVACIFVLFRHRTERYEFIGLAQGEVRQIASTTTGRLESVPVQLFQKVNKFDTLAQLDDTQLQGSLVVVKAEINQLQAQLDATRDILLIEADERETAMVRSQLPFLLDVADARLCKLSLNAILEPDRIQLDDLQLEINIARQLREKDIVGSRYELSKAEINHSILVKKIEENERLLEEAEQVLSEAIERRDEFAKRQPAEAPIDSALETIYKNITVKEKIIEEISIQRLALVLKSPFDGVVSQIISRPGEAVLPGEPILAVARVEATEVIAYVNEQQVHQISEGLEVQIIKNSQPQQIVLSQVTELGPIMELMPEQLWQNPDFPQWGRPFIVPVPQTADLKLIPGQVVGIRGL